MSGHNQSSESDPPAAVAADPNLIRVATPAYPSHERIAELHRWSTNGPASLEARSGIMTRDPGSLPSQREPIEDSPPPTSSASQHPHTQ